MATTVLCVCLRTFATKSGMVFKEYRVMLSEVVVWSTLAMSVAVHSQCMTISAVWPLGAHQSKRLLYRHPTSWTTLPPALVTLVCVFPLSSGFPLVSRDPCVCSLMCVGPLRAPPPLCVSARCLSGRVPCLAEVHDRCGCDQLRREVSRTQSLAIPCVL